MQTLIYGFLPMLVLHIAAMLWYLSKENRPGPNATAVVLWGYLVATPLFIIVAFVVGFINFFLFCTDSGRCSFLGGYLGVLLPLVIFIVAYYPMVASRSLLGTRASIIVTLAPVVLVYGTVILWNVLTNPSIMLGGM